MKNQLVFIVFILLCSSVSAQNSQTFVNNGYAISGYDPVAYFTESKPVKGNKAFSYEWHDAIWLFASKATLDKFENDPEKYAPQYGGYCAYGCSNGYKASTQPDAWTIVDGKLYLNYNTKVKELWQEDREAFIQKADKNWPEIMDK